MTDIKKFLDFALDLTKVSDAEILPRYQNTSISTKPDGTEVTEADQQAERAIREKIEAAYPGHSIMGEEYGVKEQADSAYQWVIDPVDGTAWFTLGMATFGTLIALLQHGEPVLGVIHFPVLEETVYASKGNGCWFQPRNGALKQVKAEPVKSLKDAVASASGAHGSDFFLDGCPVPYNLSALINEARKFRFCTDCLQHALVCRGRVHVGLDPVMNPWDSAAIIPCVEEAGGIASTASGQRERVAFGGSLLTTSSPDLHEEVVKLLQPR